MANDVATERPTLRLARYLKEFVGHRTPVIKDIARYDAVLWFANMPQEADCRSGAWLDERRLGDAWLEVRKQTFEPVPELPETVLPWVDEEALKRATPNIPPLNASRFVPDEEAELAEDGTPPLMEQSLQDYPEVQAAYDAYGPSWEAWSKEHRRRDAIQKVYAELFRLRTQVLKQGEIVEVVLGLGLLDWQCGTRIQRHIVVANAELEFDSDKGVIRVAPPGEGAKLRIEDEMLDAQDRPDHSDYETVEEQLREIGDDIWDEAQMHTALRTWAQALHENVRWSAELNAQTNSGKEPLVSFAPALILRKRRQTGMQRVYDALISQLSDDSLKIPKGWVGLVEDIGFGASADESDTGLPTENHSVEPPSEKYFPLPANREQRRIVEALDHQRGVLVQGPPGTGKSLTIANLICHLLATGQRVLVTAETAQALRVVKDKLPEELRPLCVSLLGQGGDAFAELNSAVQGITTKQASYDALGDNDLIKENENDLEAARRRLAQTDSELQSLREDETVCHSVANGAYSGTASEIAKHVASERAQYGWLRLPNDANEQSPLSRKEMTNWLEILRRYSEEQISQAKLRAPLYTGLVTPEEFAAAVVSENDEASAVAKNEALRAHTAYPSLSALTPALRKEIANRLREIESKRRMATGQQSEWLQTPIQDWIAGRKARWDTLVRLSQGALARMEPLCERLGDRVVTIPEGRALRKVRADAEAAMAHFNAGGKWKRLGLFIPQNLKGREYLKGEVLVDGVGASDRERLQAVSDCLGIEFAREELRNIWDGTGADPLPDDPRQALAVAKEQLSALEKARAYAGACNDLAQTMATASPPVPAPDWSNGDAEKWLELIEAAAVEDRYRMATQKVDSAAGALIKLRGLYDAHPVVAALADAVEQRNVSAYSEHYEELVFIETLLFDQETRSKIEDGLATAVPGLVNAVAETIEAAAWDSRFGAWEKAWCWAVAAIWLDKRSDFAYQQKLQQQRHDAEKRIAVLLTRLAALRAWKHFFARLSEEQKAALKGWREAVRAMGKRKGNPAKLARLRRAARAYMDKCRNAIPV